MAYWDNWIELESVMSWTIGISFFKVTKPFCVQSKTFLYQILLPTKQYQHGVPVSWIKESVIKNYEEKY